METNTTGRNSRLASKSETQPRSTGDGNKHDRTEFQACFQVRDPAPINRGWKLSAGDQIFLEIFCPRPSPDQQGMETCGRELIPVRENQEQSETQPRSTGDGNMTHSAGGEPFVASETQPRSTGDGNKRLAAHLALDDNPCTVRDPAPINRGWKHKQRDQPHKGEGCPRPSPDQQGMETIFLRSPPLVSGGRPRPSPDTQGMETGSYGGNLVVHVLSDTQPRHSGDGNLTCCFFSDTDGRGPTPSPDTQGMETSFTLVT